MPPGHPIIPLKSNKFNMARRIGNKVYCAIEPLLVSDSFVVYHISLCVRCLFLMHVTRVAFGLPFALSLVFSLIMVKPNKTSKCPGCKVLKSAHDFGTSGKHFPGPDLVEDDSAHTKTATAAPPGNVDSSAVLIKSLLDSAQKLTMEVQSLRQESQDFRKVATIQPAKDPPPSYLLAKNAATDDVTLPELRGMTALACKVDR